MLRDRVNELEIENARLNALSYGFDERTLVCSDGSSSEEELNASISDDDDQFDEEDAKQATSYDNVSPRSTFDNSEKVQSSKIAAEEPVETDTVILHDPISTNKISVPSFAEILDPNWFSSNPFGNYGEMSTADIDTPSFGMTEMPNTNWSESDSSASITLNSSIMSFVLTNRTHNVKKVLILTPYSVVENWYREFKKWLPRCRKNNSIAVTKM